MKGQGAVQREQQPSSTLIKEDPKNDGVRAWNRQLGFGFTRLCNITVRFVTVRRWHPFFIPTYDPIESQRIASVRCFLGYQLSCLPVISYAKLSREMLVRGDKTVTTLAGHEAEHAFAVHSTLYFKSHFPASKRFLSATVETHLVSARIYNLPALRY